MESKTLIYPETRTKLVRETVGGIALEDPYRWLEETGGDATIWGEAQSGLAREHIRSWEHFETVREQLSQTGFLYRSQSYVGPVLCGQRWVHVVTRRGAEAQLVLADEPYGDGEVIFDPDDLSEADSNDRRWRLSMWPDGHRFRPSPDGAQLAVALQVDGSTTDLPETGRSRQIQWLLIDIESKQLSMVEGDFATWLFDSSYYCLLPYEGSVGIFHVRLGQAFPSEPEFAGIGTGDRVQVSDDGRYAAVLDPSAENLVGTDGARIAYIKDAAGWRAFSPSVKGRCQGAFAGGSYVAIVTDGSPRGRVVSIPVATCDDPTTWRELIPESDRVVRFLSVIDDRIVLGLADDSGITLSVFDFDGKPAGTVPLPPGQISTGFGIIDGHNAVRPYPAGFYFMHNEAFLTLPSFYRYDIASGTVEESPSPIASLGPLDATVMRAYRSAADGAEIAIRLVHRPDLDLSESHPVVLHGYGNLNLCWYEPPAYFTPFLDAGGIYAWVTLRGGGEWGKEWREAGRGVHKGRCALDFCGAAEYLVEQGIADPERIACFGFSGGAFLTGIVLGYLGRDVRHDLFKAVVGIGGCYDFFTFPKVAGIFSDEWGDPTDPESAEFMRTWSPYQNVQPGLNYPATLIACTNADAGWTGHARKMVAAVQAASSSDAPVLYRRFDIRWHGEIGATSGENGPDSGEVAAEITAFIMRALKVTPVGSKTGD